MATIMTASQVHKQYQETIAAFRKLIPDPALRMVFSRQVDDALRRQALGVWQADNASSQKTAAVMGHLLFLYI